MSAVMPPLSADSMHAGRNPVLSMSSPGIPDVRDRPVSGLEVPGHEASGTAQEGFPLLLQEGTMNSEELDQALQENAAGLKEAFTLFRRRNSDDPRTAPQILVDAGGAPDVLSASPVDRRWLVAVLQARPDIPAKLKQLRAQAVLLRLINAQRAARYWMTESPEQARRWLTELMDRMSGEHLLFRFSDVQGRDLCFLTGARELVPDWRHPTPEFD